MRCAGPLIAMVSALAIAASASATQLSPSNSPLPGSSFQGADRNQDDSAPLIDWQELQAAGRVVHNGDPNDDDNSFHGGSKEDEPGEWAFTSQRDGVNPGKDNIFDAFSAVDQPGANTFLYLAFTRESANGTTFLSFDLNRPRSAPRRSPTTCWAFCWRREWSGASCSARPR